MDLGRWCLLASLMLAVATLAGATSGVQAAAPANQAWVAVGSPGGAGVEDETELEEAIFQPADRDLLRGLAQARKLVEQARYGEAVRQLGSILESAQDYFFQPEEHAAVHRSLKAEAQRLIGQMPPRGRELYELQFGTAARKMLERAAADGDAAGVAEVARRFFHTQAGYEATLLLGLSQLDQGQPLAAALTLRRLRDLAHDADRFEPVLSLAMATAWVQAGAGDEAAKAVRELAGRHRKGTVRIAGRNIALPADRADPLKWIASLSGVASAGGPRLPEQWIMARGDAARNATSDGGPPLLGRLWRIPVSDHPLVEGILEIIEQGRSEQSLPMVPALAPLVAEDVVLMRTLQTLVAVDLKSGKRLWETSSGNSLEAAAGDYARLLRQPHELVEAVRQRVWRDTTYGTISSDGCRVFAIEDLPLAANYEGPQHLLIRNRRVENPSWPQRYNRLVAREIRTGKLVWQVGGSSQEPALPQAGSYFLGPPLALMGRLYALAEVKGEIRLITMDAASGRLLWGQQLAVAEQDILRDSFRRVVGISPSYADGFLVCPTANGGIVAVDLATRSLVWGYVYGRQSTDRRHLMIRVVPQGLYYGGDLNNTGIDASVILADGRVLVAPVESDQLHCLQLSDGKFVWKQPRDGDLYVGCVSGGKIILVGQKRVRAVRLADGMPAWDRGPVSLADQGSPSGTGFLADGRYYVPLSSAKVLAIDVATGKVASVSESGADCVPGNLVCYKDRIVSQSTSGLDVFYQRGKLEQEVAGRLARRPDDVEALRLRGEIFADERRRAEAVECFRKAYRLAPDPTTRKRLREALLAGLAADFAAHRNSVNELESLIEEPGDKAALLRLTTQGLAETHQWHEAVEACLRLVDLGDGEDALEAVEPSRLVGRDRWVREQMAGIERSAPAEVRAEIRRTIQGRLSHAEASSAVDDLRRWIACFGGTSVADEARPRLVARLAKAGRLLEAENLLRQRVEWPDHQQTAAAVAQWAELLRQAGRPEDAAVFFRRLAEEFADVVCGDGKTGRELVEDLPADDAVRRWIQPELIWPVGRVEVKRARVSSMPAGGYGVLAIHYVNDLRPFFTKSAIRYDRDPHRFVGRDGFGRPQWSVSLAPADNPFGFSPSRSLARAGAAGHFLMLDTGGTMLGVDGLASTGSQVLWTRSLSEPLRPSNQGNGLRAEANRLVQSSLYPQSMSPYQRGTGATAAVTTQTVCCFQGRSCVARDPLSGKPVWVRQGVALGTALVADDEFVFLIPPGQSEALVLRASDGAEQGRRAVPPATQWRAIVGRKILVQKSQGGRFTLAMYDPWEGRELWNSQAFPAEAKMYVLDHEAVGVMDSGGHFVLLALEDGRSLVDRVLDAEKGLAEIFVLRSDGQYLLVTHLLSRANEVHARSLLGVTSRLISRGRVYAFDLDGNEMWPEPVSVKNQQLLLDQPERLPVLTFACNVAERQPQMVRYQTSVLAIDKRNGRVLLDQRFVNQSNYFELVGDPEQKTVEIRLQQELVTMTFTEQPLPPDSEVRAEAARSRAFWRMLRAMSEAIEQAAADTLGSLGRPAEPAGDASARPKPQPSAAQRP